MVLEAFIAMNRSFFIYTTLLALTANLLFGQIKRADNYYEKGQYSKALPQYKKEIKKSGSSKAVERLADCFWETKKYYEAEAYFSKLSRGDKIHPSYFFYYGLSLYNVGKIKEAYRQFYIYSEMQPMEKKGFEYLEKCDHIKYLQTLQKQYEVFNVEDLNTSNSEFSPSYFKNSLLFTAERRGSFLNFRKNKLNKPYLDIYYSSFNKNINRESFYNLVKLPRHINTKYDDGPACFNGLNNQMIFTRKEKNKGDVNTTSKLYVIKMEMNNKMEKNKWEKPENFKFNSDSYSVSSPSLSHDGQFLYFASDMPGGYGGMDIYVCERWRGRKQWTDPVNLGPDVNTVGDENFPYLRSDGTLYFSSDNHKGYGGLDVFSATFVNDKWTNITNVGSPINSTTNDFGIIFADDFKSGFFSSDRVGGKGRDDLYRFDVTMKYRSIDGRILYSETKLDPAINTKILLVSDVDTISEFTTDSSGYFRFNNLLPDVAYQIKMDEQDSNFISFYNYFLMDENDSISLLYLAQSYEDFVYQTLPAEEIKIEKVDDEDRTTLHIAGNIFIGDDLSPLSNAQLNLLSTGGNKIDSTKTNVFGSFVFTSVPKDESVEIKVGDNENLPGNTKITLTNSEGKELIVTQTDASGKFDFKFLSGDENILSMEKTADTDFDISGKLLAGDGTNRPIVNSKVDMLSETGQVLKSTKTDSSGWFGFKKLNKDDNYLFGLDETDPQLKGLKKVLFTDEEGTVKSEILSDKDGKFRFRYLAQEYHTLEKMEVKDTELKIDIKGKLLSDDKNSSPIAQTKIDLLNEDGAKLDSTITNNEGSFEFSGLPVNENYVFSLDDKDTKIAGNTKIILTDEAGNKVKELKADAEGKFRYKLLPADYTKMGKMYVEDPWLDIASLSSQVLQKVDSFTITESIYYETGAWEILPEAKKTLNKIIIIMKNDSSLAIKFASHTDSRASDAFNLRLSKKRSEEIVSYFIASGISTDRVLGIGLGETKLINHCKNAVPCTEEQHAQNRRAEFKVYRRK